MAAPSHYRYQTVFSADYKAQLSAAMGVAPSPRMALPTPVAALPGPKEPVPNTTEQNKKSNVLIPYSRVVRTLQSLDEEYTLVFVRNDDAEWAKSPRATRIDRVASMGAVNEELAAGAHPRQWRLDGILLSTEAEMDAPRGRLPVDDVDTALRDVAVNIGVQGPCPLRNDFSHAPHVGDVFYIGLADLPGQPAQWFCFSASQLNETPDAPLPDRAWRVDQLGRSLPAVTRAALRERLEHLNVAYKVGSVLDTNLWPARNGVQVHLDIRPMHPWQLGLLYDVEHSQLIVSGPAALGDAPTERRWYTGYIGSQAGALGGAPAILPTAPWLDALLALRVKLTKPVKRMPVDIAKLETKYASAGAAPLPPAPAVFQPVNAFARAGALARVRSALMRDARTLRIARRADLPATGRPFLTSPGALNAVAASVHQKFWVRLHAAYAVTNAALPLLDAIASNDAAELNRPQLSTARAALLDFVTNVVNALKMLPYAYVPPLARPAGNAHRLADNFDLGNADLNQDAAAALAAATDEAVDPVPLVAALQRVWTLSAYAGIAPPA